jgi:hypothetical protein
MGFLYILQNRCKNKTQCKRQDFIRQLILKGKTKLEA